MGEWIKTTLGEFVAFQRGHDLPQRLRKLGDVPVVGSGGVTGCHDTAIVKGPGITVGRAANLGVPVLTNDDFWPLNTTLYVTDFRENDVRFSYYLLKTIDLTGFNSGSVQPMLNRNYIKNYPILVPTPHGQRAIASVLGALDDKIAVNERIGDTALDLAIARYVSMSGSEGWSKTPLANTARWLSGGTPKTSEPAYWDGDLPWISALSLRSPWIDRSDRNITSIGAKNGTRLVPRDTVIFVVRGSSLDTEFRVGITQREVAFGQDCKALRATGGVDPTTLFLALKAASPEILKLVDHTGHGAGRLSTDLISKFEVALPDAGTAKHVASTLKPLVWLSANQKSQNEALAQLRDTLLPKLMSGELRIRDAEKVVEDAT